MVKSASARWNALPYLVGAAGIAFFTASLAHLCSRGHDSSFPHVAPGSARYQYCFVSAPTRPWLLLLVFSGAVLVAGAVLLRGRRWLAWALVCALVLAMLLYEVDVRGMSEYPTPGSLASMRAL